MSDRDVFTDPRGEPLGGSVNEDDVDATHALVSPSAGYDDLFPHHSQMRHAVSSPRTAVGLAIAQQR